MKTSVLILLTIVCLSCEKIPYTSCREGNYGYLAITAEYQWISIKPITTSGVYKHTWFGWEITRTAGLPEGQYRIGHSDPQPQSDKEMIMMLRNEYAPIHGSWIDDTINITRCDTVKLRFTN